MDTVDKETRSHIMARVKSSGNKSTEIRLEKILRKEKLKGWRRNFPIYGKPDFVFPSKKVAMFVDGCFWHGCPKCCRMPGSNRRYWEKKIGRNVERDKKVRLELRRKNWRVVRIWEHELKGAGVPSKLRRILARSTTKKAS